MKDMNIAKLSSVDVPLFNGIVSDLFPGVESPVIDYSKVSSLYTIRTPELGNFLPSNNCDRGMKVPQ